MVHRDREPFVDGADRRLSMESASSGSTTSLVFDHIQDRLEKTSSSRHEGNCADERSSCDVLDDLDDTHTLKDGITTSDLETGPFLSADALAGGRRMDHKLRRMALIIGGMTMAAWILALVAYVSLQTYKHGSEYEHDPEATSTRSHGKKITLDEVQSSYWDAKRHTISWIAGANGEDGLLLEQDSPGKDYLIIEDVRARNPDVSLVEPLTSMTLMKVGTFEYGGKTHDTQMVKPSPNLQKVLVTTDYQSNWRHSYTAVYWIWDVRTQTPEPLIPDATGARIQLAQWTPSGDAVVYTMNNDMYLRNVTSKSVKQITRDGGAEYFYGIPDWVYEEEVFEDNSATWISQDGQYVAFLRTNETGVPEYPIQYFASRPSGKIPAAGEENYPEERRIKYPKAGAHNPVVDLLFYDIASSSVFSVDVSGGFADADRLITEVVWVGQKVLVRETNRISDVMRVVLVDMETRRGKTVRSVDVGKEDGGWFEVSHKTAYIPADPKAGRPAGGYIETVIYDNYNHLAYFSPLDTDKPTMLTKGDWEVTDAPSAVDLKQNLVYFVATKESSIQRHVYHVKLDGTDLQPFTNISAPGYYGASFSSGAGYTVLSYNGPKIPWQKVLSTPSSPMAYEHLLEDNKDLTDKVKKHELPIKIYGTLNVDGVHLNYVELRPPHFNPHKKYPVLFNQYSGPGSQSVNKRFTVEWLSYLAGALGYVVVTVDGRGTGFIGRSNRVIVRGHLGQWESHDQIAAAKHWSSLPYVDPARIAIWGWSYGGFMALKTLEQDAGQTFSYGMAVAPVTDWRYYDSIYTERYMKTPQENEAGYDGMAINNATALGQNVRFLVMHGIADDNVHMQNSVMLLDKLDLAGVENYDVHVFPDSDHSIFFHGAHRIVYDKMSNWLVNAFNGEWLRVTGAKPIDSKKRGK